MTYDPLNILDEDQGETLSDQARLDIISLVREAFGRRFVYRLAQTGGVFTPSFSPDPHITAFREGARNLSLRTLSEIQTADPENYRLMMIENL